MRPSVGDFFPEPTEDDPKFLDKKISIRAALIIGFIVALMAVASSAGHTQTRTRTVTVTATAWRTTPAVTVTETIAAMPEACQAALQFLKNMEAYTKNIINVAPKASEDLQNAYVAITRKDLGAINKAQRDLQLLDNSLVVPAQNYQALMDAARSSTTICLNQMNGG